MRLKRCRYCLVLFRPDPRSYRPLPSGKGRLSVQVACAKPACRQLRHQDACQRWHGHNPTYDDGRQEQRRKKREYMRRYRENHEKYVEGNREKQRQRDAQKRDLVNRDAILLFSVERMRHLIDLVTRDAIPPSLIAALEEIWRQMARANRLVTRDVMALQERIEHNRGHEPTA